ncbi:MAG TPA: helix-turn-helix domain-containing protein [Sphingomicrobium sp.]|jgi:AraC-like DNA-binding protein|nr:helix-turn-helix domain-containing protein [Sphingomicrobium sp.]
MAPRELIGRRRLDDGVDRWEMIDARPAAALRSLVSHYAAYWEETRSFSARQELATTRGVLIYALAEPVEIVGADGKAIVLGPGEGFAGGISDKTSISRNLGVQAGVHVFLPLTSLAAVLGIPLAEVANRVATMRDLIGPKADELGGRLVDAVNAACRFDVLDDFLARRFADRANHNDTIRWSMQRLARASGPSCSALADEIGWSRRHFARRFRYETGFSPDRFRRIARFERFVAGLTGSPSEDLADLAIVNGYADQPHLARDVRDFADTTPGDLRARLIPQGGGVRDD